MAAEPVPIEDAESLEDTGYYFRPFGAIRFAEGEPSSEELPGSARLVATSRTYGLTVYSDPSAGAMRPVRSKRRPGLCPIVGQLGAAEPAGLLPCLANSKDLRVAVDGWLCLVLDDGLNTRAAVPCRRGCRPQACLCFGARTCCRT